MKVSNRLIRLVASAACFGFGTVACATDPASEGGRLEGESTVSGASALVAAAAPPPSSTSAPAVSMDWQTGEQVSEHGPASKLALRLVNNQPDALDVRVSLEIRGLGALRIVDLGTHHLLGGEVRSLAWAPTTSPIAPVGTAARVTARASYTRLDVAVAAPTAPLYLAFSANGVRAFVSRMDGLAVRLASLGRLTPGQAPAMSTLDRAAILEKLGSRQGRLDGKPVNETRGQVVERALAARSGAATAPVSSEDDVGDSASIADTPATTTMAAPSAIPPGGILIPCQPGYTTPLTTKICPKWKAYGFTDLGAERAGVVPEDYNLSENPAAFANASVYNGAALRWEGRLDSAGCTPEVTYCPYAVTVQVASSSLQKPAAFVNGAMISAASREVVISPPKTFSASVLLASSTTTGTVFVAKVQVSGDSPQTDNLVRVAAVASRILTMSDNGVATSLSTPALVVHTENGCPSYPELEYGGPGSGLFGEACASSNNAWFGPALGSVGGSYQPTGHHTTEQAYVIAHELGHTAQMTAGAVAAVTSYGDAPLDGSCSCSHVADGNKLHCLQSLHSHGTANVEGFAHHYASRVMNDKGSTGRFTYYKSYRNIVWTRDFRSGVWSSRLETLPPPIPLNAGTPYASSINPTYTGWARNYCAQGNKGTEYDWMTFLWAVNGAGSSTMNDLFAIFSAPQVREAFVWPNLLVQAQAVFGASSPQAVYFVNAGQSNGINSSRDGGRASLWVVALVLGAGCGRGEHAASLPTAEAGQVDAADTSARDAGGTCPHVTVTPRCHDDLCLIPAGCFIAGSPVDEPYRGRYNEDQRETTLTHSFVMGQHEVTQGEWVAAGFTNLAGTKDSADGKDCTEPSCPASVLTFFEAVEYANTLSSREGLPKCVTLKGCTGKVGIDFRCTGYEQTTPSYYECAGYRLPTGTEFEYATRAGTQTTFYTGPFEPVSDKCIDIAHLDDAAWYCRNSSKSTHPVRLKKENSWGLHDLMGNAAEYVASNPDEFELGFDPVRDPQAHMPTAGAFGYRGAAFHGWPSVMRAAFSGGTAYLINSAVPDQRVVTAPGLGFRLVRSVTEAEVATW